MPVASLSGKGSKSPPCLGSSGLQLDGSTPLAFSLIRIAFQLVGESELQMAGRVLRSVLQRLLQGDDCFVALFLLNLHLAAEDQRIDIVGRGLENRIVQGTRFVQFVREQQ